MEGAVYRQRKRRRLVEVLCAKVDCARSPPYKLLLSSYPFLHPPSYHAAPASWNHENRLKREHCAEPCLLITHLYGKESGYSRLGDTILRSVKVRGSSSRLDELQPSQRQTKIPGTIRRHCCLHYGSLDSRMSFDVTSQRSFDRKRPEACSSHQTLTSIIPKITQMRPTKTPL